jgi:hypothetical protein
MRAILFALLLTTAAVAFVPFADACSPCPGGCHVTYEKVIIYNLDGRATVVPVPNGYECGY